MSLNKLGNNGKSIVHALPVEGQRPRSLVKLKSHAKSIALHLSLVAVSLIMVAPVAWILLTSVKSNKDIMQSAMALPSRLHWDNFRDAWIVGNFGRLFINSCLAGVGDVVLVLIVGSMAGFAFARMRFKGNQVIFSLFFLGLTIPITQRVGPLLSLMYKLGLNDTLPGLALAYAASDLPFAILMMRSFFRAFPLELEHAARVDGCNNWQFFHQILLPISRPALVTVGIFTFMSAWNDFIIALYLINNGDTRTLPLGLLAFQFEHSVNYALSIAGITITALPVILVYIIFQRTFVEGLTAGSLK